MKNTTMKNTSENAQPAATDPSRAIQDADQQAAKDPKPTEPVGSDDADVATLHYDQGWLSSFMRPVLIVMLVVCLNLAILTFLRRFMPSLAPPVFQTILALSIIAALTGSITSTWLAQPAQRSRRTGGYVMAEWALLILLTRIVLWALTGDIPTLSSLFTAPLNSLFDGLFVTAAIIVTISWIFAAEFSKDLLNMALTPAEIKAAESGTIYREAVQPGYVDRQTLLNSFASRWVVGGLLLVVLAAGTNMGFAERGFVTIANQSVAPAVILAVVVYFLVGLMLLSHGQLAILRARWALEQTPSRDTILRHWPAYAFALLVAIGALAALMPFGGTFWLARIITMIIGAAYFVVFALFQLVGIFFALIMSLLPFKESEEIAPPPPPPQQFAPPPAEAPPSEFLALAGSTVFWVIALVIVGYAAYVYFTDKGFRFTWITWLWQMLIGQWRQAGNAYQSWQRDRVRAQSAGGEGSDGSRKRRWFSWGKQKRDPDAQIRFYYLSLLKEAESKGLKRQDAETPLSYAPRLTASLPAEPDPSTAIDELTGAFVQVRYTDKQIDETSLPAMEQFWQQIRRILRA